MSLEKTIRDIEMKTPSLKPQAPVVRPMTREELTTSTGGIPPSPKKKLPRVQVSDKGEITPMSKVQEGAEAAKKSKPRRRLEETLKGYYKRRLQEDYQTPEREEDMERHIADLEAYKAAAEARGHKNRVREAEGAIADAKALMRREKGDTDTVFGKYGEVVGKVVPARRRVGYYPGYPGVDYPTLSSGSRPFYR